MLIREKQVKELILNSEDREVLSSSPGLKPSLIII